MKVQEFQHRKNQTNPTPPCKTNQRSHAALFILLLTVIHFLFTQCSLMWLTGAAPRLFAALRVKQLRSAGPGPGPRAPGRAGLTRHPAHPARARSRAQGAAGALLINPRHRALPWGTAQHRAEAPCPQQGPAHGWLCCSVTHGQEELACLTDTQMSPIHGVTESFR